MEALAYWLIVLGKAVLGTMAVALVWWVVYIYWWQDKAAYKQARQDIFSFVESYKLKCRGNNRFVVTVATLQDSFREYDTKIIERVWQELVDERKIMPDPQDNEWCVR
jgi:hypothetical protein